MAECARLLSGLRTNLAGSNPLLRQHQQDPMLIVGVLLSMALSLVLMTWTMPWQVRQAGHRLLCGTRVAAALPLCSHRHADPQDQPDAEQPPLIQTPCVRT